MHLPLQSHSETDWMQSHMAMEWSVIMHVDWLIGSACAYI